MPKEYSLGLLNFGVLCLSSLPQSLGFSSTEGTAIHLPGFSRNHEEEEAVFDNSKKQDCLVHKKEQGFYHLEHFSAF